MTEYIVPVLIVAFPIVLGILLRVNASFLFFSVMSGELLARHFGDEAELAFHTFFHNEQIVQYSHLFILSLPVLLTAIVLKNSVSRSKVLINLGPLIVAGLVYAAFAVPILPPELHSQFASSVVGQEFIRATDALIGFVVLFELVILWLTERGDEKSRKRKRKKD